MDFAYDLINDRSATSTPKPPANTSEPTEATTPKQTQAQRQDLSTEFAETIHAFAKSPWGTKLGGWWSTARTQGSQYYETARQEAARREAEAAKALAQARDVVAQQAKVVVEAAEDSLDRVVNEDRRAQEAEKRDVEVDTGKQREGEDTESFLVRFRAEATKRLEEVRKAEDKADEALLRFGTNVRNFLKDAVAISAPGPESQSSEVIFESRDATGKRVIHTSRLDAQLHVIHITPDSFTQDPEASEGWQDFKKGFDIEKRTDGISADLERYPDLRSAMEKLVPEQVEYKDFWMRYYFLRHVVALQEEKRKELLQASATDHEEVGWDEESDSESQDKPQITQHATHARTDSDAITLKAPRRSHDEKSVADSEASYDLVSGAASHANSSPKEKPIKEESDDDDWE